MTESSFWSDTPMLAHGTAQNPHVYGTGPHPRDRRECQLCRRWRPPVAESLTHPVDRRHLDEQLPTARVFGDPLPDGCLILEDPRMTPGTIRLRIEGNDITVTLGEPPNPRWIRCDPLGETPFGTLR